MGSSNTALAELNCEAIALLHNIRQEFETAQSPMVMSGCVGPRGDSYIPTNAMTAKAAQYYHQAQISTFRDTDADLITAITINYVEEAIGITRTALLRSLPVQSIDSEEVTQYGNSSLISRQTRIYHFPSHTYTEDEG